MFPNRRAGQPIPDWQTINDSDSARHNIAQYGSAPTGYGMTNHQSTMGSDARTYHQNPQLHSDNTASIPDLGSSATASPSQYVDNGQMRMPLPANTWADGPVYYQNNCIYNLPPHFQSDGSEAIEAGSPNAFSGNPFDDEPFDGDNYNRNIYGHIPQQNLNSFAGTGDLGFGYNHVAPGPHAGLSYQNALSMPREYRADTGENEDFSNNGQSFQDRAPRHGDFVEEHNTENEPNTEYPEERRRRQGEKATDVPEKQNEKSEKTKTKDRDAKKGQTRQKHGALEVWDPAAGDWRPAVIHHDIRSQLQRQAQEASPGSSYAHPDLNGGDTFNDTSFFSRHQNWGPDRDDRPDILYRWEKGDESELPPDEGEPGWMEFESKIVLDPHDNPIKDYWNIPAVLSPWTAGYKLEAMSRENPRIRHTDFWARMPRHYNEEIQGQTKRTILSKPNARVNMPMGRFRSKAGCQSWELRDGTANMRAGLMALFGEHKFDPVKSGNSTRGFGRDLEPWEGEQIRLGNLGQFAERAGDRAVDEGARAEKVESKKKRIDQKKATANGSANDGIRVQSSSEIAHASRPAGTLPINLTVVGDLEASQQGMPTAITSGRAPLRDNRRSSLYGSSPNLEPSSTGPSQSRSQARNRGASNRPAESIEGPVNFLQQMKAESRANQNIEGSRRSGRARQSASGNNGGNSRLGRPNGGKYLAAPIARTVDEAEPTNSRGGKRRQISSSLRFDENGVESPPPSIKRERRSHSIDDLAETQPFQALNSGYHDHRRQDLAEQYEPAPTDNNDEVFRPLIEEATATFQSVPTGEATASRNTRADRADAEVSQDGDILSDSGDSVIHEKRKQEDSTESLKKEDADEDVRSSKRRYQPHGQLVGQVTAPRRPGDIVPGRANLAQPRQSGVRQNHRTYKYKSTLDYREVAPSSVAERRSIDEALEPTREAYFEWTGYPAPPTDGTSSYMSQYRQLQRSFAFTWGMEPRRTQTPDLVMLSSWDTSVSNWEPPIKDDKYFEAWRRGHRAPRTPDGALIAMPGNLMERLAKKGDKRALMLEGVMLAKGYVPEGQHWEEAL